MSEPGRCPFPKPLGLLVLLTALLGLWPKPLWAQTPTAPPAASGTTSTSDAACSAHLEAFGRCLGQGRPSKVCTERCFVLQRLRITGSPEKGALFFELEGGVLAGSALAVPLFGPPSRVRLDQVTENGKPASIGFEVDHYYLFTASPHFVLRGTLSLDNERTLSIVGPLNTFEAQLADGRVVEGSPLSGLVATTLHFDLNVKDDVRPPEPTVFQLSRALRVGREITFQYRLVMRSGTELGVIRLPLSFGEQVLEVQGSTGWRVEKQELLLPTSGRSAELTISGTLSGLNAYSPDPRSPYEWWLFESDAEHRLSIRGEARQVDAAESPIARTQPNSRLFILQKGQKLDVSVQTLASTEVLAAIVQSQNRTVIVTKKGDMIFDDRISYENKGIDYLLYNPQGRAIYQATDGRAERIMHREGQEAEVLVPLQTGTHSVHLQALSQATLRNLGGRLMIPMSSYPLTASSVHMTLGFPEWIYPLAVLGGDHPYFFLGFEDAVAAGCALVAAWLALRTLRARLVGAFTLLGLWFLSPPMFVLVLTALTMWGVFWLLRRLLQGPRLAAAVFALMGIIGFVGLITFVLSIDRSASRAPSSEYVGKAAMRAETEVATPASTSGSENTPEPASQRPGGYPMQTAGGGVLKGVTPVALPLPSYSHSVAISRELMTPERPFVPILYYVTYWTVLPLGLAWLAAVGWLVYAHRQHLARLQGALRAKLTPALPPSAPPPPAAAP